jgi:Protein of unknown function (DUF2889)
MSDSTPDREPIHTRSIVCRGYRRSDGLWDIEATLTDTKSYAFENSYRGRLEPGDPVHEMRLTLTFDDRLTVQAVKAETLNHPWSICPTATPAYQKLIGLQVRPGWTQAVRERTAGAAGCTHLTELLGTIATTAFQTVMPLKRNVGELDSTARRPALLDSCVAYAEGSEHARRLWPAWHEKRDAEQT